MGKGMKKSRQLPGPRQGCAGYIISPRIDFWTTGGISILVMCVLLAYAALHGAASPQEKSALIGSAFILQLLINWPHFMASYGLLYRPAGNIRKYVAATVYVPVALVGVALVAVLSVDNGTWSEISVNQDIAYLLWLGAAFYLAWHYTGQAWGMIATFSRLSSIELLPHERLLIRGGLRLLLVWHVTWGAEDLPQHWLGGGLEYLPGLLTAISIACCAAFAAGIAVWLGMRKRAGAMPDARILASWVSIYMWYLVLYFMPEAYLFVQLSHSLQYLIFPFRVELNKAGLTMAGAEKLRWGLRYSAILLVSSLVVFYLPEHVSNASQSYTLALVIASCVSIHHYFVDSCIWKISNPGVRSSLFAHLATARN